MMKSILLGSLTIAATLGGHYAAGIVSSPKPAAQASEEKVEVVKLEPISAPVIRDGKVVGYVIARMSIATLAADAKAHKELLVAYASEAVFRGIYEEKAFDFAAMRAADVSELGRRIVELANKRFGKPAIREAVVESINFVSHAELQSRRAN
jgi:hypothetical protein